jgi:hypothetical protein
MSSSAEHVIIDSKYKMDPNGVNHDFIINLQNPITNFKSVDLVNVTLPNNYYNVSAERNNISLIFINPITFVETIITIPEGNYSLDKYLFILQSEINTNIGINTYIIVNDIKTFGKIIIFNAGLSNFNLDFSQQITYGTSLILGFEQKLYTSDSLYISTFPPSISPLAILINIDAISRYVSTSNNNIRLSTFIVNNTVNAQEYVQYFDKSAYNSNIKVDKELINSLRISVKDTDGFFLHGLGNWIMILRFNRY